VIVCTVPSMSAGATTVTVTTGGKTSNGASFTVGGPIVHAPSSTASSEADLATWHNHEVLVAFEVADAGSDAAALLYSVDGAAWEEMDLALYSALRFFAPSDHSNDSDHTLAFKARDAAGTVEAPEKTLHVMIDTVRPAAKATVAVVVHKGHSATLKYRINDVLPNGGSATGVLVKVKNRYGQVVKTFKCGTKTVNKTYSLRFRCKLAKGSYRYYVSGIDTAGNLSTVGSNRLTVLR
jgi:hypothetical protein